MPLNIHYLRVFSAVMSGHSLAHAALDMHTSHSNVKRIVEVLERELGVPLFNRLGRGVYEPTDNAMVLKREMSRFLTEINDFEGRIKACEQIGKTLRIGAEHWFFETEYFVRFFHQLRRNAAYRATFVEIATGEEKHALEAGHCDILIGAHAPAGRRLQSFELPPTPWYVGVSNESGENHDGLALGESWGLHFPSCHERGRDFIRQIEHAHGGNGHLISTSDFRAWNETQAHGKFTSVVAVAPAVKMDQSSVQWRPLSTACSFPVSAVFLTQHPYGCLKQVVHGTVCEMNRCNAS